MRIFKYFFYYIFLLFIISSCDSNKNKTKNVLFIAVDDLRDFTGFLEGHPDARTLNLDSLAAKGIAFSNAHCQAPMCAPSRASLLSGKLPSTTGHYGFQQFKYLDVYDSITTLPKHFRDNGYYTMGTGKIHHAKGGGHGPLAEEWNEYWPSLDQPKFPGEEITNKDEKVVVNGNFHFGPSDQPDSLLAGVQHANWAIDKLQKEYDQPFFLAVGFFRPHLPFIAPREYFDQYEIPEIDTIKLKFDDLNDVPKASLYHIRYKDDYQIRSTKLQQAVLKAYLACVSYTDAQIGRILDALENSSYADNTIIVLWSDHGWHFGEKRTWRKFTLWEESTRVPIIIVTPEMKQGKVCSRSVQLVDIYPTLVELCNLPQPDHQLEGHSLVPLLEDPETEWKWPAITTNGRNSHALTTEKWKYIKYFDGTEELYDKENDPMCWNNLATDQEFDHIKKDLAKYLPEINAPNAPTTTWDKYWDRDYPDLEDVQKVLIEFQRDKNFSLGIGGMEAPD